MTVTFRAATSYAVGSATYSVTTADVNGDGKPDLVAADEGGGVSVLLGDGSGGFGAATSYAAGPNPYSVQAADVNGDGRPDLVVADIGGGVSVLLGNGSGGFGAAASYAAGQSPSSVTVADVNGDGKPDFVVADQGGGVTVLLGDGSGGIGAAASYAAGSTPASVTTADVNRDGRPDLVVADEGGGVSVLLGTGSGGFGAAASYAAGPVPVSVTTADVNRDGKLDLLVADFNGGVSVLLGDGSGGFGAAVSYAAGPTPYSVTSADVDADGKPDLIVGDIGGGVSVLLGDGSGGFGAAASYAAGSLPGSVTTADLNGDGKPDLVVGNLNGGVSVLLGNGSVPAPTMVTAISVTPSVSGPLDAGRTVTFRATVGQAVTVTGTPVLALNDGATATYNAAASTGTSLVFGYTVAAGQNTSDLVVTALTLNGATVAVPGSMPFGTAVSYDAGSYPRSVTTVDVNGDGKPDLVVADRQGGGVSVLLGDGSGGFGAATSDATGPAPYSVAAADVNGDGKPDLVVADIDGFVSVLLGNGGGGFGAATTYAAGAGPVSLTTADLNGDGKPDLIVADQNGGISVLLGNGSGGFGAATSYAAGSSPRAVTTVDVNGDGKLDLVVSDDGSGGPVSGGVSVLLGNGSGGFSAAVQYDAGRYFAGLTTADVNRDGKPDIIVANRGGGVSVLLGDGSGGFGAATSYAAGPTPFAVAAADVNGDGQIDIVVADVGGGVSVLLGDGSGAFGTATHYAAGVQPLSVTTADVNGDGKPDIIVASDTGTAVVLLNSSAAPGTFSPAGVAGLPGADTTLVIDTTAPTITSDTADPATGDYTIGEVISFTLATSEAVFVTGAPTLTLNDGGSASYVSGSGTTGLVFSTTVAAGQNAATLAVTGVGLPAGALIQDGAGNQAVLTGSTASFSGLQIDSIAPVVSSPTLGVGENSAPTAIGIATPTDTGSTVSQLAITAGTLPADGTVTLANGTAVDAWQTLTSAQLTELLFTPTAGQFDQSSSFTYLVTDPAGNASTGTATLAIGPAVGNPAVSSPSITVAENGPATAIGIAAPTDPNYTTAQLTITAGTLPTDGTVTLANGTAVVAGMSLTSTQLTELLFKPTAGQFDQSSSFTYSVTDPAGNASTGTATLAIGPAVGNPAVSSPSVTVAENGPATAIGITAPTDPNYTTAQLTITAGTLPMDGTVTLANGTAVAAGQTLTSAQLTGLLFTPTAGRFDQSSSFTYSVTDPAGNASAGTTTLAIGPAVGNPAVSSPSVTVAENGPATAIGIVAPTDPNYTTAQLTITAGMLPTDGTVTLANGTAVTAGQALTSAQLAGLLFTPTAGKFGVSSAFTYSVTDPAGNASAGTATLVIGPAVGNPAVSSPSVTVAENGPATAIGIVAPTDPNYTTAQLTITAGTLPTDGTVTLANGTAVAAGQTLTSAQLTGLQFTPTTGDFSKSSSFTYAVTDPASNASIGTATLAIGPAVGNPTVSSPSVTVAENGPATAIGIAAPTDPNYSTAQLTITAGTLPTDGTVTLANGTAVTAGQALTSAQLAGLLFTPTAGKFGVSSAFTYSVTDPAGNASAGTATLVIGPAVGNPAVSSPSVTVAENGPATAIGIVAPTDPNYTTAQLTITAGTLPTDGKVTLANGTAVAAGQTLTSTQLTGLLFTPTVGQFGQSSSFTYSVTDPAGNASTGTTTLAIGPAVGNPAVSSPSVTVAENAGATAIGITAPTDPNYTTAQLTITAGTLPTDGTVTLANGTAVTAGQALTSTQLTGLLFKPTAGQFGQSSSFTYAVTDPAGNASTGTATLAIGPAMGNPSVSSPSITVAENAGATAIGIATPTDPNYTTAQLTITAGTLPTDGTVTLANGTAVAAGQTLTSTQLTGLLFTPTAGQFDQSSSFTYAVADPAGNASTGSATLAIGPAVGNPTVSSPSVTVAENGPATAIGIAAPTDPNYTTAQLTITAGTLPTDGTVTLANGTAVIAGMSLTSTQLTGLLFKPTAGKFDQSSSFTYSVTDPAGNASTGTATLAIGPAVGNPAVSSPSITVAENAGATAIGIAAPTDPNYTTAQLTITAGMLPTDGTVTLANGTAVAAGQTLTSAQLTELLFTPTAGQFDQSSSFTYSVTDPANNASTGTATLAIGPAVGNPAVSSPSVTVAENGPATAIGIVAPTDPNYTTAQLTITAGTLPTDGTVTLANGTAVAAGQTLTSAQLTGLQFTPTTGDFSKSSSFTYAVADPAGNASIGTATLAIGPAVGNPTVSSPSVTVAENGPATAIGIVAPTDPNYTTAQLTITAGTLPADGTVTLANGTAVTAGMSLTSTQLTELLFMPTAGKFGTSSAFTYSVTDPAGNASTGTTTLAIGPAVGNPAVSSPSVTVAENAGATAIGIAAPTDPNYTTAQLTITAGTLPTDGTVTLANGTAVTAGQALTSAQLTGLLFTPTTGQFDQSSSFTYSVTDPANNASIGTARLVIGPAVGNPAVSSPSVTVAENGPATAIGIVAPTDPNYTTAQLTITAGTLPTDGKVTLANGTAVAAGQTLTSTQLTGLLFTPTAGQFDQSSSFTYSVTDPANNASTGTATLAIGPAVGNPAVSSPSVTVAENGAATAIGITAPTDPNYTTAQLTITAGTLPTDGTVILANGTAVAAGQTLTSTQLTGLLFTPTAGQFDQSSSFTYAVADPAGNASTGSATLAIGPAVGNPTVSSPSVTVAENGSATAIGIAAPTDPNYTTAQLTITAGTLPTDGTVTLANGTAVIAGMSLTSTQLTGLLFKPTVGQFGQSSSFTYAVADPAGNASTGSATLAIGAAVGNPAVSSPSITVAENAGATAIGIAAPTDPNYTTAQLTITAGMLPTDGTVTLANGTAVAAGQTLTSAQLAGLLFKPTAGQFDQSSSFTYAVADPASNASTGTATLAIGPAVGNPAVSSPSITVAENAGATAIGIAAPTDPNYTTAQLTITAGTLPTDGTVTLANGTAVAAGQTLTRMQLTGLLFTPTAGKFGQTSVFTYAVADPAGNASTGTATLAIGPAVGNPAVSSPSVTVAENGPATAIGIAAPTDPNYTTAQLTITAGTLPTDGTVILANGMAVTVGQTLTSTQLTGLLFKPTVGKFGQSSIFTYAVADPAGNASTGTATLAIGPALGNPSVSSPSVTVAENGPATPIGIVAPTDPNYTTAQLTITAGTLPSDGTVTLANGTAVIAGMSLTSTQLTGLLFKPTAGQFGQSSSFTYAVADPAGNASTGSATLAIGPRTVTAHAATTVNLQGYFDTVSGPATPTPGNGQAGPPVSGPAYGNATVTGTQASETITANGYNNTVVSGGGNDVINAGLGQARVVVADTDGNVTVSGSQGYNTVLLGNGNDIVSAVGYFNAITLGDGADSVTAGAGYATVTLGGGADSVTLAGYFNIVTAGNGNDSVGGGQGNDKVTLGNGKNAIVEAGYFNMLTTGTGDSTFVAGAGYETVHTGGGNDVFTLAGYANTVTSPGGSNTVLGAATTGGGAITLLGTGNNMVTLGGYSNVVTLGSGIQTVDAGSGSETITAGAGTAVVTLHGYGNSVTLGAGADTVTSGAGNDTIHLSGGTARLVFTGSGDIAFLGGSSATITDSSSALTLKVSAGGVDTISGFGAARGSVIDLLGGDGGFTSAAAVVRALTSDGHGGTLLALGSTSSIDFTGLAPTAFSAANFKIG